jgi:crotonobetainyl-CoA:carnitine CoA-transferase CaiB-like acyl-CoA transferase
VSQPGDRNPPLPLESLPPPPAGRPFTLLDGVTVLDLTTSIAGPYATLMLADMGAEVLKVERPGAGDDARHWGPPFLEGESLWYLSVNRNKRSVTLDFTGPAGRAVLEDLVRTSDVVVTNHPPRVQDKLRLDADALQALRPDLVHVSLTGFGLTGERAEHLCYDLIAEGHSGVMDLTGEVETEPQKVGTPAADLLAGMDAAYAAVAALFDRQRTGRGHRIEISLVESMTRFLSPRLVSYLGSGEVPRRSGGRDSVIAIYQSFDTADRPITLGLGNDNIWRRFWAAVGQPGRGEDPDRDSNAKRRDRRAEIVAEIQVILRRRGSAHWLETFAAARVPAGPINRVDEVTADPLLADRGLFYALERGDSSVPQVGTGIHVDGAANPPRHPPPALGQDTRAVLRERLGYDESAIEALARDAVI